jgi:hypothetical protein
MNRDREQDDNQDDETTVERELPETTCEGMGDIPKPIDDDSSSEERTR